MPTSSNVAIVVVFVSLGGFFVLAFMSMAFCWFIKCRKKKQALKEKEELDIEDHVRIQEATIPGPHGNQILVLKADEDVQIHKEVDKSKNVVANKGSKSGISEDHHHAHDMGASTSGDNQSLV